MKNVLFTYESLSNRNKEEKNFISNNTSEVVNWIENVLHFKCGEGTINQINTIFEKGIVEYGFRCATIVGTDTYYLSPKGIGIGRILYQYTEAKNMFEQAEMEEIFNKRVISSLNLAMKVAKEEIEVFANKNEYDIKMLKYGFELSKRGDKKMSIRMCKVYNVNKIHVIKLKCYYEWFYNYSFQHGRTIAFCDDKFNFKEDMMTDYGTSFEKEIESALNILK